MAPRTAILLITGTESKVIPLERTMPIEKKMAAILALPKNGSRYIVNVDENGTIVQVTAGLAQPRTIAGDRIKIEGTTFVIGQPVSFIRSGHPGVINLVNALT